MNSVIMEVKPSTVSFKGSKVERLLLSDSSIEIHCSADKHTWGVVEIGDTQLHVESKKLFSTPIIFWGVVGTVAFTWSVVIALICLCISGFWFMVNYTGSKRNAKLSISLKNGGNVLLEGSDKEMALGDFNAAIQTKIRS